MTRREEDGIYRMEFRTCLGNLKGKYYGKKKKFTFV